MEAGTNEMRYRAFKMRLMGFYGGVGPPKLGHSIWPDLFLRQRAVRLVCWLGIPMVSGQGLSIS